MPETAHDYYWQLAELAHKPVDFVYWAFPWGEETLLNKQPDPWQLEILQAIQDNLIAPEVAIQVAVASGHGIGKSALVAWLILWAISTRIDTRGVVTAGTQTQLLTKTWPELNKWVQLSAPLRELFEVHASSIHFRDTKRDNRSKTWRIDAIPWSEKNPEAFAGLHNQGKRLLIVFDEASQISTNIWETIEGALTDADTEIIWACFGNPTRNTGRFYQCFGKFRHRWITKQIDSRSVAISNKAQIQQWVDDYGEDHDFVRVRVRGVFPRSGVQQFIPSDLVQSAVERKKHHDTGAAVIMGVDVARFGDDQSVIAIRQGRDLNLIKTYRKVDLMHLASEIAKYIETYDVDATFIDGIGVGGGVIDRLRQLGHKPVEVNAGSNANDKTKYFNKRCEMWDEMRTWLKDASLPHDQELIDDLTGLEYTYQGDKLMLEKKSDMKKRGLNSPDIADALAHTFAERVARRDIRGVGEFKGRGFQQQQVALVDYDEFAL